MNEGLITHLRHVDLAVPDYDRQLEFYTNMWGLKPETTDDGIAFLAAEGSPEQYSVRLRRSDEKRLDLISFGAADAGDVDALAERLGRDGVQLVTEPDKLQTPGGGYGFRIFDNDGRTIEVSFGVEVRRHRKIEQGESIPVKLSHVVINSPNPEATVAFYDKHLSFALSDTLFSPHMGEVMWFLRTNKYHHSLAIALCPHVSLHHASFELRGIDEYMRGTGRLLRGGVEKV
jgi:catechol 2,3-dioxygenase-like lactoylglutathione lyase family enzyme